VQSRAGERRRAIKQALIQRERCLSPANVTPHVEVEDGGYLDEVFAQFLSSSWRCLLPHPISVRWEWLKEVLDYSKFIVGKASCRKAALEWCDLATKCLDATGTGVTGKSTMFTPTSHFALKCVSQSEDIKWVASRDVLGHLLWMSCTFSPLFGVSDEVDESVLELRLASTPSLVESGVGRGRAFVSSHVGFGYLPAGVKIVLILIADFLDGTALKIQGGQGEGEFDFAKIWAKMKKSSVNVKEKDVIDRRKEGALRTMGIECLICLIGRCVKEMGEDGGVMEVMAVASELAQFCMEEAGEMRSIRAKHLADACAQGSIDAVLACTKGSGSDKSKRLIATDFGSVSADIAEPPSTVSYWGEDGVEKNVYDVPTLRSLFPELPEMEESSSSAFTPWGDVSGTSDALMVEARYRVKEDTAVVNVEWRLRNRTPSSLSGVHFSVDVSPHNLALLSFSSSLPHLPTSTGRGAEEGAIEWVCDGGIESGKVFYLRLSFVLSGVHPVEARLRYYMAAATSNSTPSTPSTAASFIMKGQGRKPLVTTPAKGRRKKEAPIPLMEVVCASVVMPVSRCFRLGVSGEERLSAKDALALRECGHAYASIDGSIVDFLRAVEGKTGEVGRGGQDANGNALSGRFYQCDPLCLSWGTDGSGGASQCLAARTLDGGHVVLLVSLKGRAPPTKVAMRVEVRASSRHVLQSVAFNLRQIFYQVYGVVATLEPASQKGASSLFLGREGTKPLSRCSQEEEKEAARNMEKLKTVLQSLSGRSQSASFRLMGAQPLLGTPAREPRPQPPPAVPSEAVNLIDLMAF